MRNTKMNTTQLTRSLAALAILASVSAQAQALTTGDLAFTSFNADEDGWSVVTFVDIAAGTDIYFADNEATSATTFNTGESAYLWNTGADTIAAGTVIRFSATDTAPAASFGNISIASGANLGLSASNETLYAYLGTGFAAPTTFLAALSTEGSANLTPAGLTTGVNAVVVSNSADYAAYVGDRSSQMAMADYAALVNDAANWNIIVGSDNAALVPDVTGFTAAVPEPETYAMMLVGLGLLGVAARQRGKA